MLNGFVLVVIVVAIIGSLIFFLLGQPCCFWCYCLLVHDKDFFFSTLCDCLGLPSFGSIFLFVDQLCC